MPRQRPGFKSRPAHQFLPIKNLKKRKEKGWKKMTEQKFHVGVKALVRNEAGDILVLKANPATFYNKKDKAHWDLPGGRINEGGGVKQTLERELGEELGIKGKDLKIGRLFDGGISNITLRVGSEKVGLVLLVYECFIRNSSFRSTMR